MFLRVHKPREVLGCVSEGFGESSSFCFSEWTSDSIWCTRGGEEGSTAGGGAGLSSLDGEAVKLLFKNLLKDTK